MTDVGRMEPEDARRQLAETTQNLNRGNAIARTIVNGVNRGDREKVAEATQSFIEFWHDLPADEQERLALNALTMAMQLQDNWNTLKAQYGGRKIK